MDMLRHVAKIANTDQRCVVAFMQIPNREDHALVIPVDNLPPRMEQAVMDVLNSPEGQNEETFAMALSRRLLPDNGQNILEALHSSGRLAAVPVAQVLMMPRPNQPVKLSSVLESLGRLPDQQTRGLMEEYAVNKFNPHINNQVASSTEQSRSIARNLLVEAEMLEADAKRKREQAYGYDATMRPRTVASPVDDAKVEFNYNLSEPVAVDVPNLPPNEPSDTEALATMMAKLMEKVEEQDRVLTEMQSAKAPIQEQPEEAPPATEAKHGTRRNRSTNS